MDAGDRVMHGAITDDCMDAGDRVMHGAITEELSLQGLKNHLPLPFSKPVMGFCIAIFIAFPLVNSKASS